MVLLFQFDQVGLLAGRPRFPQPGSTCASACARDCRSPRPGAQVQHHGDLPKEVTLSGFRRFLCDTPLAYAGPQAYPPGQCPPSGFGSFHQQYWLDGKRRSGGGGGGGWGGAAAITARAPCCVPAAWGAC